MRGECGIRLRAWRLQPAVRRSVGDLGKGRRADGRHGPGEGPEELESQDWCWWEGGWRERAGMFLSVGGWGGGLGHLAV